MMLHVPSPPGVRAPAIHPNGIIRGYKSLHCLEGIITNLKISTVNLPVAADDKLNTGKGRSKKRDCKETVRKKIRVSVNDR